MPALLASSSEQTAQAWLGYVPADLARSAAATAAALPVGSAATETAEPLEFSRDGRAMAAVQQQSRTDSSGAGSSALEVGEQDGGYERAAIHAAIVSFLRFSLPLDPPSAASSSQVRRYIFMMIALLFDHGGDIQFCSNVGTATGVQRWPRRSGFRAGGVLRG